MALPTEGIRCRAIPEPDHWPVDHHGGVQLVDRERRGLRHPSERYRSAVHTLTSVTQAEIKTGNSQYFLRTLRDCQNSVSRYLPSSTRQSNLRPITMNSPPSVPPASSIPSWVLSRVNREPSE